MLHTRRTIRTSAEQDLSASSLYSKLKESKITLVHSAPKLRANFINSSMKMTNWDYFFKAFWEPHNRKKNLMLMNSRIILLVLSSSAFKKPWKSSLPNLKGTTAWIKLIKYLKCSSKFIMKSLWLRSFLKDLRSHQLGRSTKLSSLLLFWRNAW